MSTTISRTQPIPRASSTDPDDIAFVEELERYRGELRDHCRRLVRDRNAAEDLAQEAIVRAWRARARFEGRSSLRTWVYRIATNVCLDALRREGRTDLVEPVVLARHRDAKREDFEDRVVAQVGAETVLVRAARDLPPRQRTVVVLRDAYGWSARDAAAAIDGTVASANSALQRARTTLRRQLRAVDDFGWAEPTPCSTRRR